MSDLESVYTDEQAEELRKNGETIQKAIDSVGKKADSIADNIPNAAGGVAKTLATGYANMTTTAITFLPELMVKVFSILIGSDAPDKSTPIADLISDILEGMNVDDETRNYFHSVISDAPATTPLVGLILLVSGVLGSFQGWQTILLQRVIHQVNKELPSTLISPEQAVDGNFKGYLSDNDFSTIIEKLGLTTEAKKALDASAKQLTDLTVLYENLWRNKIDEKEFMNQLKRRGYDTDQQELLGNVANRIPGIQDIILFSVREAFREDFAEKYKYDEEYPLEVERFAKMQGYEPFWSKMYWRSHWELPSPQMVFEMLHRRVIDTTTVAEYLKMADYPQYWREKLIQISYRPLTRVDVRRMYRLGVFDNRGNKSAEQHVYDSYRNLGYNDENAKAMTDFTVAYVKQQQRGFTTTQLRNLYIDGVIDVKEYRERLEEMNIREDDIDYNIEVADYEKEKEKLNAFMKLARKKYIYSYWDKNEIIRQASKRDLQLINIDDKLETWEMEREALTKLPTKTDILSWFAMGILSSPDEAIKWLTHIGYSEQVSKNYVLQTAYESSE